MRTYEEVKEKAVLLRNKYLKERIREFTCQKPVNCQYFCKVKLANGSKCGVCTLPKNRELSECNCEVCKKCPKFVCRNTDESVIDDFNEIVDSASRCGQEYPKLAILLWFLQDYDAKAKKHSGWFGFWR